MFHEQTWTNCRLFFPGIGIASTNPSSSKISTSIRCRCELPVDHHSNIRIDVIDTRKVLSLAVSFRMHRTDNEHCDLHTNRPVFQ